MIEKVVVIKIPDVSLRIVARFPKGFPENAVLSSERMSEKSDKGCSEDEKDSRVFLWQTNVQGKKIVRQDGVAVKATIYEVKLPKLAVEKIVT